MSAGASRKRLLFRILDHTLNPLTIRAAKRGRGPFSLVKHVGRKTGKHYETPIIVAPVEGGFVVELTYGDDVAWYRNSVAANGCVLVVDGIDHVIDGIEPISTEARSGRLPATAARHPEAAPPTALRALPRAPA